MIYTLYTGNNCHQCKAVVDFLVDKKVSYKEVNIDEDGVEPPVKLFVFPALFKENTLIAYGIDIIDALK